MIMIHRNIDHSSLLGNLFEVGGSLLIVAGGDVGPIDELSVKLPALQFEGGHDTVFVLCVKTDQKLAKIISKYFEIIKIEPSVSNCVQTLISHWSRLEDGFLEGHVELPFTIVIPHWEPSSMGGYELEDGVERGLGSSDNLEFKSFDCYSYIFC